MSLKQTANYQLDTSQQLINTDLDITLDDMIKGFIPRISTLGRETRPHAAHRKDNSIRVFPDATEYPRTRLSQDPYIPSNLRTRLSQDPYISSNPITTLSPEQGLALQVVPENLNIENSSNIIEPPPPAAIPEPGHTSPAASGQAVVNNDQTQAATEDINALKQQQGTEPKIEDRESDTTHTSTRTDDATGNIIQPADRPLIHTRVPGILNVPMENPLATSLILLSIPPKETTSQEAQDALDPIYATAKCLRSNFDTARCLRSTYKHICH